MVGNSLGKVRFEKGKWRKKRMRDEKTKTKT